MSNINYEEAVNQILRSIQYLIEQGKKSTKVYDGRVVSKIDDKHWNIAYNGGTFSIPLYGTNAPEINTIVKVIVPEGNQNLAWFF